MDHRGASENLIHAAGAARVPAALAAGKVTGGGPPLSDMPEKTSPERRQQPRERVLKAAKIVFGGGDSIFNCLILDESPEGIFVDMGAVLALPNEVVIQYASGAAFRAVRRWATGSKVGFQFVGPQIIGHETARRMQMVAEIMKNHGMTAAMQTLRVAQFFDNLELRRTAEAAEAALRRLDAVLAGGDLVSAGLANPGPDEKTGLASLGPGSRV
jgi:hypothetical protein